MASDSSKEYEEVMNRTAQLVEQNTPKRGRKKSALKSSGTTPMAPTASQPIAQPIIEGSAQEMANFFGNPNVAQISDKQKASDPSVERERVDLIYKCNRIVQSVSLYKVLEQFGVQQTLLQDDTDYNTAASRYNMLKRYLNAAESEMRAESILWNVHTAIFKLACPVFGLAYNPLIVHQSFYGEWKKILEPELDEMKIEMAPYLGKGGLMGRLGMKYMALMMANTAVVPPGAQQQKQDPNKQPGDLRDDKEVQLEEEMEEKLNIS